MAKTNQVRKLTNAKLVVVSDCQCGRVLFSVKKTKNIDLDALSKTYEERNSLRSTGRIFTVSHFTVYKLFKNRTTKAAKSLDNFNATILPTENSKAILEVDEISHFVLLKVNQIRIWIAQNRQIISFFIGDGSMESCKRLW